MQLCAILAKHDLSSIIEQITPLRVAIRPRRVITLGRPTKIELVAGAGLRVRGDARFTWDVFGFHVRRDAGHARGLHDAPSLRSRESAG